jgi:hypothetical protein
MTISQTPSSITERRLAIAHRLYEALVGQDPDRAITLCGSVVARHDPGTEQSFSRDCLTKPRTSSCVLGT